MKLSALKALCCSLAFASLILAQVPAQPGAAQAAPGLPGQAQAPALRPDYVLGPNDQILVKCPQAEEINERPFRIDAEGFLTLPIVGRMRASGLSVQVLEAELATKLREFIREPVVAISLVQFRSDPVFFVGAFRVPGIYPLQGRRTLVEMLSSIGGLAPNASRRIRLTRRAEYGKIDLPNAIENPEKKTSVVEISLESLTQDVNPAEDVILQPYDIVSVERAERIYVSGDVARSGAVELAERQYVTTTQAVTEAGGLLPSADRGKVRVLRPVMGTTRRAEILVDMDRVLRGEDLDFPLQPNDVLYVPRSGKRAALVPLGTGLATSLPFIIGTIFIRR